MAWWIESSVIPSFPTGDDLLEWFFQYEGEATEKASVLRARGFTVEMKPYVGGYALEISGPPAEMENLWTEIRAERNRRSEPRRILTGTVRWWSDEKGFGRITGDDGYVYFCHFSDGGNSRGS